MAGTIGLGVARFAYALVLPAMRAELGLSYGEAGLLNTTNAAGYLLGALVAASVANRIGVRATILWGVAGAIASLALCAVLRDFTLLNGARALGGVGGALAFVGGGVLAANLAGQAGAGRSGAVLGAYYAAPGLGIALSGLVVPVVIEGGGLAAWPWAWAMLAALCVPLALWLAVGTRGFDVRQATGARRAVRVRQGWIVAAYCGFGMGYIGYMTFMIARVRDGGGGPLEQGLFWATLGCGAIVSAWAWRGVMDRFHGGRAFALLCGLVALGAAVPLLAEGTAANLLSAALFGSVFFSVVASTTAFVRRNYAPGDHAAGIGSMTVAFGVGQIVGPIAVGWLNDRAGGLEAGLAASAAVLLLSAALALPQRDAS